MRSYKHKTLLAQYIGRRDVTDRVTYRKDKVGAD